MVAMKLLALCLMVSSSESRQFLPINAKQDPADALADKLLKTVGLDSDPNVSPVAVNWKTTTLQDESAATVPSRSRESAKDVIMDLKPMVEGYQAMVGSGSLEAPKAWSEQSSTQSSRDWSSGLSSLKSGMKHMFNDLANPPKSKNVANWDEFASDSSESTKEVVKITPQDTVVHQPAHQAAASSMPEPKEESSVPAYMNKFNDGSSAGLRWFKQPLTAYRVHSAAQTKASQNQERKQAVNATEEHERLEARVQQLTEEQWEHEGTDSLAKSLAAEFKKEKKKGVAAVPRSHLPTGTEIHVRKGQVENVSQVPQTSALNSVHRARPWRDMLPIRPEDVHPAADPEPQEIEQAEAPKIVPEKKIVKQKSVFRKRPDVKGPTVKDGTNDLFNANAVNGFVDAVGMDAVLEHLGTKKQWDWHAFDRDGDGQLSHEEFANAVIVAQRFKAKKN